MCDFMEFSKIKISKDVIDVNLLLEDIEDELKLFIRNKKIILSTYIMKSEVFVEGDYNRLKQVFVNIVKNSVEAINGDGVIKIFTHVLSDMCYIEFVDNGKGMDNEELSRVKEMFFTTKKNGSGLGVSLSDEIIKAHNGNMDYYSRVGVGTRVVVKLPVIGQPGALPILGESPLSAWDLESFQLLSDKRTLVLVYKIDRNSQKK